MERVGGRQKKMEGHCSTGQSPQWAVVTMGEGEEEEEEEEEEGEEGEEGEEEEEEEELYCLIKSAHFVLLFIKTIAYMNMRYLHLIPKIYEILCVYYAKIT